METIIITLLGINLYLLFDYILDNYYFNGTKTKEGLVLNRHLYYEFIQIVLLVAMIFIQISLLPELPWTLWLFPILFIILWASRIQATYNNWACEIRIEKEKVIFIDFINILHCILSTENNDLFCVFWHVLHVS
jgi:hypothetical protein